MVVAGGVMLLASRTPRRNRWMAATFGVILAVFFGLMGFYFFPR
jgi:hypothetical protein